MCICYVFLGSRVMVVVGSGVRGGIVADGYGRLKSWGCGGR